MAPPGAREGREGVDPSSTHLRVTRAEMCRRGARPLAPLAGAGDHDAVVVGHHTSCAFKFAPMGLAPVRCLVPTYDLASATVQYYKNISDRESF
jgi:hypothetical protein